MPQVLSFEISKRFPLVIKEEDKRARQGTGKEEEIGPRNSAPALVYANTKYEIDQKERPRYGRVASCLYGADAVGEGAHKYRGDHQVESQASDLGRFPINVRCCIVESK